MLDHDFVWLNQYANLERTALREAELRSFCKIPRMSRFSDSRIILIWIIAALVAVHLL
jgi:hypothetical protein